ncbi:MAG: 50S ribosomal protein L11 methyltransferase [Lachnospiraceae bacterium]|nr:50S ribosomal protein L11 methyltransferase [Lachnospiraceae bacterium]
MKWNVIRIRTTNDVTDYLAGILFDLGFEGIEVTDTVQLSEQEKKAMFIDFLPELDETDRTAVVTCYTEENVDPGQAISQIREELEEYRVFLNPDAVSFETGVTEDTDWINNWKQFFKSFAVDEDIYIKPTWEPMKEEFKDKLVIEIDPGTAFGTGSHETTRLAIANMKKYLKPGDRLLDIGTGSGILSVIGMKLGAGKAIGTDIDPIAVRVAGENAEANGLSVFAGTVSEVPDGSVAFYTGNMLDDEAFCVPFSEQKYPIVVANILADVIIPLAPVVRRFLLPGGVFVCSGIINLMEEKTKKALTDLGYEILNEERMNDWVSYAVRLPG